MPIASSIHSFSVALLIGAMITIPHSAQVENPPGNQPAKKEVVPDFGQFIPEHEVLTTSPWKVSLERVTTAVPWGRGMATVDGQLIILSRGRHRSEGGPDQTLNDSAGTLWRVDTSISEPVVPGQWAGEAVRHNATVFAAPTSPPFHLYDYTTPPEDDILMARPYCALAFDPDSRNLFVCAYAGAELESGFRKHGTDAVYRYDLRNQSWHIVEQHDHTIVPRDALGAVIPNNYYPHHDPATNPPPHGWTNGADGCIAAGKFLYVPAKDNHLIVQYDLDEIRTNPDAPAPNSRPVLDAGITIRYPGGEQFIEALGPSGVAIHGDDLYIAYRTSSIVIRVKLDADGDIRREADGTVKADLIAVFEPWNAERKRSGNLYDIVVSKAGDLYVSMGTEGRIWRITPDPERPFYGNDQSDRPTTTPPFVDMTELVGRKSSSNNIHFDDETNHLYISSRNNDNGEGRIFGTIYRVKIED